MGARYATWIDGEEAIVELLEAAEGRVVARIEPEEGAPREVTLDRIRGASGDFHVLQPDGRAASGYVLKAKGGERTVVVDDHHVQVVAVSERDAWLGAGGAAHGEGEVTVSMPGLVVKVLVVEGEQVEAGQSVLIIEAMKMENEVKADRAGVVTAVHVGAGDRVEADMVLMEIGDG
ncbi:MAG: biotin/lipoyl-containing protein [Myxococcota bacterium]